MHRRSMQKCIGVVLLGWYFLLPHRDDGPPGANQPASFERWQRVGAYDSALGCGKRGSGGTARSW